MSPSAASVQKVTEIARNRPAPIISPTTAPNEAFATMQMLGTCGKHTLAVTRFQGQTAWQRHPLDDELLFILEGEVTLLTLNSGDEVLLTAKSGEMFRVPAGLWHCTRAIDPAAIMSLTVGEESERSATPPKQE